MKNRLQVYAWNCQSFKLKQRGEKFLHFFHPEAELAAGGGGDMGKLVEES